MQNEIEKAVREEAERLAKEYHEYHNNLEIEHQRNKKRIRPVPDKEVKVPEYWYIDKKYNPFYVLKHLKPISRSIAFKLENGNYTPNDPYLYKVIRNGKQRETYVYQIPDAAVSKYLYERLLSKNRHRFSSLSYAYRNDRNVHFAIQDISYELKRSPRVFVAEFDFKDFFGSINHNFLNLQLKSCGFLITEFESSIINVFLGKQENGIPLGTSISLFLANAVCWQLDRNLENEGLRFARYADDTVIWSPDYQKICRAFEVISKFSTDSGIKINLVKSEGISLLQKTGMPSEFYKTKDKIEFLGYKLSGDKVSIKDDSVRRIKKRISYLLYRNLIQPIRGAALHAITLPANNQDPAFVSVVTQIRRYLYGNLNDSLLKRYMNGSYKRLSFKGLMSFYPLLDDEYQLKQLDGWLIYVLRSSLKKREKLLQQMHNRNVSNQFPFNASKSDFIEKCRTSRYKGRGGMMEIPSFLRIYKAIKKGVETEGIERTMNPKSNNYDY